MVVLLCTVLIMIIIGTTSAWQALQFRHITLMMKRLDSSQESKANHHLVDIEMLRRSVTLRRSARLSIIPLNYLARWSKIQVHSLSRVCNNTFRTYFLDIQARATVCRSISATASSATSPATAASSSASPSPPRVRRVPEHR